jgi:formate/nitrite transporter FocA (FNT family)
MASPKHPSRDDPPPRQARSSGEALDDVAPAAGESAHITTEEQEEIEERSGPRAPVIYEIVRKHGEEEMTRPTVSLWWSGVAAGLSISFSLLAQALLQMHLPHEPWRPLVSCLGYSVGFLMVVLARQQLFTENTITVVLPVMAEPTRRNVAGLARMWTVVFLANMVGAMFAAGFCTYTPVIGPELRESMLLISRVMMENTWPQMFFKGISAGFLIAALVWLIPSADGAQFHVILLMTYLIALGEFTHIVAGSVEAFMLVAGGEQTPWSVLGGFMLPVLLGNIIGGTALFALISYAQIMKEL